jgi:sugar phosphate isomerase/epimerase
MNDKKIQLTILNFMAGPDFERALDLQLSQGITLLDLKNDIYGLNVEDLSDAQAARVTECVRARGMRVHCLSSMLGLANIAAGETAYCETQMQLLAKILRVARILEPRVIRILAAKVEPLTGAHPGIQALLAEFPWLPAAYRSMVGRIAEAGLEATIKNESPNCILANADDVVGFLDAVGRPGGLFFTWDTQHLWQMGTFPSLDSFSRIREVTGGLHLKGGRSDDGRTLAWASGLEDASWPVIEIVRSVIREARCPVICLNPSHGKKDPTFDPWATACRDIAFLRRNFSEIA